MISGTRMVVSKKDFFLTLEKYSLCIMSQVLFMCVKFKQLLFEIGGLTVCLPRV